MNPKYVVLDLPEGKSMFIFPPWINHRDFSSRFNISKDKIISAGFIQRKSEIHNHMFCYGHSQSLGIGRHIGDELFLEQMMKEF